MLCWLFTVLKCVLHVLYWHKEELKKHLLQNLYCMDIFCKSRTSNHVGYANNATIGLIFRLRRTMIWFVTINNQSISQSEFIHAKGNNKTNSWYVTNRLSILLTKVDLKKVLLRGCSKIELQYWMIGYYPNCNAKPRGSNLNLKKKNICL